MVWTSETGAEDRKRGPWHDGSCFRDGSRSTRMSACLSRNWWAIGLRGAAAILFVIAILCLPSPTIASLVLMFATYVAADGAFAILAGMRAAPRGEIIGLVFLSVRRIFQSIARMSVVEGRV